MASFPTGFMSSSSFSDVSHFFTGVKQKVADEKRRRVESLTFINQRHGFQEEEWLEITRIAIRVLLPFVATLFVIMLCPPLTAKIILPGVVMSVIFLSALYGQPDRELISPMQKFNLIEIPPERFYEENDRYSRLN